MVSIWSLERHCRCIHLGNGALSVHVAGFDQASTVPQLFGAPSQIHAPMVSIWACCKDPIFGMADPKHRFTPRILSMR